MTLLWDKALLLPYLYNGQLELSVIENTLVDDEVMSNILPNVHVTFKPFVQHLKMSICVPTTFVNHAGWL